MVVFTTHMHVRGMVAAFALACASGGVIAGGFQINETSASGLGNAFAGGAASAQDASTLWSNVAGLSRIESPQVVGAIHLITPSLKFRNGASSAATSQPLGGDGGDAGGLNVVPNLYLAKPLGAGWSVGLGVNAPWGLVTEYDNGWVGRFQAIKSSIKTIDVNPGVSWKVGSNMALGLGLNAQRMDAEFTNQVNYSGALLSAAAANGIAPGSAVFNAIAAATAGLESSARIKGLDTSYGWNAGVLWDLDGATRVGAHYRSSLKYQLEGSASFANPVPVVSAPLAATVGALSAGVNRALAGTTIQSLVKLPAVTNLSFFTKLDDRWDLMADAQWTGWSSIRSLTFTRGNGTVLQSTPENFRNTWKLAVGANYRLSDDLLLRGGLAIDQSPVRAAFRTPRLPDADRTWLSAGVQYTVNPRWKVDVSGAYLFVRNSVINANAGSAASFALVNGDYRSGTAIVSAQMTYAF